MDCISLINGKFVDYISVHDRGLFYGDGFFETMLWDSFKEKNKVKVNVKNDSNIFKINHYCSYLILFFRKYKN